MLELALSLSIVQNNLEKVKYFIQYANKEIKRDAISEASSQNRLEIIKYLVSVDTDPSLYGIAICKASKKGYFEVVKYLLSLKMDKNRITYSMRIASENGHVKIVSYAMSLGADVGMIRRSDIVRLILSGYDSGEFNLAYKLSFSEQFTNSDIKNSLARIEKSRSQFLDNIRKNFADTLIIFQSKLGDWKSDK